MFDGNHRSRRNVNLGSRRVRSRTQQGAGSGGATGAATADDNKTSLLKRTEQLRKERHAAAQREQAARHVQRRIRGHLSRSHVVQECLDSLLIIIDVASSSTPQQQQQEQQSLSLERHSILLNYTLGWTVQRNLKSSNSLWLNLVHIYARRLSESSSSSSSSSVPALPDYVWIHRIVLACLHLLQTTAHAASANGGTSTNKDWLLGLFQACQSLVATKKKNNNNNNASSFSLKRFLGNSNKGIIVLAETALVTNLNPLYEALQEQGRAGNCPPSLVAAVGWSLGRLTDEASLEKVVQALISATNNNNNNNNNNNSSKMDTEDDLDFSGTEWRAAVRRLARPNVILKVALPRVTLLPLVLQNWKDDPALLALTQWRVAGKQDAPAERGGGTATNAAAAAAAAGGGGGVSAHESDSDDNDDEAENDAMDVDMAVMQQRTNNSISSSTSTARRMTKPQISTLVRMEKLARETQDKWRQNAWSSATTSSSSSNNNENDDMMAQRQSLAQILSDPSLWVTWGRATLSSSSTTSLSNSELASNYIHALALILPTSLLARTSAMSPVLTKLAFDTIILQGLWQYTRQKPEPIALTVWSNVWAQTLMVIRDNEFLAKYAVADAPIKTADVVQVLRQALYQAYWTVPVLVDDVVQNFHGIPLRFNAHFILAGTKLFNSLYQRWCRLVRQASFATEDIWWFPNLSTNTRVQLNAPQEQEEDSDSDDDSDAMDISPADVESEALAAAFDDPKLSRILTSIPQALPFEKRVKLFDSLIKADKTKTQDESFEMQNVLAAMMRGEEAENRGKQRVEIRREHLYEDAMHQLNQLGPKLRQKVQVSFINKHGAAEAGIDGGGVFKEFLDDLVRDAFSPEAASSSTISPTPQVPTSTMLPLFTVTPLETLAVNLDYTNRQDLLSHYEFLGRAIGKAVYEGILVDPQFCLPFLNQLLGKPNSLEDLKNFDPEFHQNLTKLLSMRSSEFADMGLTFEFTIGKAGRSIELRPGGAHQAVTAENVIPYAHLVAHQLLNVQTAAPVRAFLKGFRDLVPAPWVRLFAAHELQKIISGDDKALDVVSFKGTMQYAAGYHPSQQIIQWFWEIVEKDLSTEQQCKLLKFMTSCSRQPLLGFNSLEPAPCIQQIRLPENLFLQEPVDILKRAPLPTSSTCMNLLKLPNYRSKELMRVKLIAAIESNAGFELT